AWGEQDFLGAGGFTCLPNDSARITTLCTIAEVTATVGDAERAAALMEQLQPYGHLNVVVGPGLGCFGAVARYLGLLATTCGRFADAEHYFTHALALNTRLGGRAWVAHTQADFAAMLLRRGKPGHAAQAAPLRAPALPAARALCMPPVLHKPGGPPPPHAR